MADRTARRPTTFWVLRWGGHIDIDLFCRSNSQLRIDRDRDALDFYLCSRCGCSFVLNTEKPWRALSISMKVMPFFC